MAREELSLDVPETEEQVSVDLGDGSVELRRERPERGLDRGPPNSPPARARL